MAFEIPKISGQELNFFAGSNKSAVGGYAQISPVSPTSTKQTGSKFHKELDEVSQFGAQKAANNGGTTYGLWGASTPPEGKGEKFWSYA